MQGLQTQSEKKTRRRQRFDLWKCDCCGFHMHGLLTQKGTCYHAYIEGIGKFLGLKFGLFLNDFHQ